MYVGTLAAASNKAHWLFTLELFDPTNANSPIDPTAIDLAVRAQNSVNLELIGSLADTHIVKIGAGQYRVTFAPTDMAKLIAGSYDVGIRMTADDGTKIQLLAATLPIVDGVVDP